MLKFTKWIYELGYSHARKDILEKLDRAIGRQYLVAERIKLAREQGTKMRYSPHDHEIMAQALTDFAAWIDPSRPQRDIGNEV